MSEILKKLAAINRALPSIEKTKKNGMQFATRGIDEYYAVFSPLIKEHGVVLSARVISTQYSTILQWNKDASKLIDTVKMDSVYEFTFYAEDDSKFVTQASGTGFGNDDKGHGKAQSYALKNAFNAMFCIPTKEVAENEVDYQHSEYTPAKQVTQQPTDIKPELDNFNNLVREFLVLNADEVQNDSTKKWANGINAKHKVGALTLYDLAKHTDFIAGVIAKLNPSNG